MDAGKGVALYHVMRADEDFETTADILFQIVRKAAREFPGKPRYLYLDVEGHRNSAGGYDADAYELYSSFILGYLGQFLTEVPLISGRARRDDSARTYLSTLSSFLGGHLRGAQSAYARRHRALGCRYGTLTLATPSNLMGR
jgi:hypothetical protein